MYNHQTAKCDSDQTPKIKQNKKKPHIILHIRQTVVVVHITDPYSSLQFCAEG